MREDLEEIRSSGQIGQDSSLDWEKKREKYVGRYAIILNGEKIEGRAVVL